MPTHNVGTHAATNTSANARTHAATNATADADANTTANPRTHHDHQNMDQNIENLYVYIENLKDKNNYHNHGDTNNFVNRRLRCHIVPTW